MKSTARSLLLALLLTLGGAAWLGAAPEGSRLPGQGPLLVQASEDSEEDDSELDEDEAESI